MDQKDYKSRKLQRRCFPDMLGQSHTRSHCSPAYLNKSSQWTYQQGWERDVWDPCTPDEELLVINHWYGDGVSVFFRDVDLQFCSDRPMLQWIAPYPRLYGQHKLIIFSGSLQRERETERDVERESMSEWSRLQVSPVLVLCGGDRRTGSLNSVTSRLFKLNMSSLYYGTP